MKKLKKLKKGERVRNYLMNLINARCLSKQQLFALKAGDLVKKTELTGIGKRTIQNNLNQIKVKLFPAEFRYHRISKKKRVWLYLEAMLADENIDKETMRMLSWQDLINKPALQGIGKTTIACNLNEFKEQCLENGGEVSVCHDDQLPPEPIRSREMDIQPTLMGDEVSLLKSFVYQLDQQQELESDIKIFELRELKMALHYLGINHKRLLKAYREDVSRFGMTHFS